MLTIEHLWKTYAPPTGLMRALVRSAVDEPVDAVCGVEAEASPGTIVGLVGPNGAGKSTLIRVCGTLLEPTRGRVVIDGVDTAEHPEVVRRNLGLLLADERALYWRLTGRQNLRFFGEMAGLSSRDASHRADELLERYDLASRDRRVFGYSSGMRVRLGLARAMVHRPRLLILDEPSRSLDPLATSELHRDLAELAAGGATVVLSSHRLDEIEAVCDLVLVMIDGRQVAFGPVAHFADDGPEGRTIRALLEDASNPGGDR